VGRHGLAASFRYAFDGLVDGSIRDRNLRIHLALGVLAGCFAAAAPLLPAERAVLVVCVAATIAAEAANSALEAAVDLACPRPDERARRAKDSAAGAVLALAVGSVLALLAVAAPRATALRAWAAALGPSGALRLAGGAGAGAVAAGLLPAPGRRPALADVLLAALGGVGLAAVALAAESLSAWAIAWLCLSVGATGAGRRRRDHSP
jgi:diacylglycerol kinase (ATP)